MYGREKRFDRLPTYQKCAVDVFLYQGHSQGQVARTNSFTWAEKIECDRFLQYELIEAGDYRRQRLRRV